MGKVVLRCYGCGCELQNSNPNVTGYTPKLIEGNSVIFCQRCFRLQHYGINNDENVSTPKFDQILAKAIKKKNLILYVVDLFNIEGSIIKEAHKYIKDNPVLVLANKRDILPKLIDDNKLREFVYQRLKSEGVKPLDIIIVSAYKNYNLDEIYLACRALRNKGDIYIIGASSVGKSSFLNSFMKSYKNETRNVISTSPYPGTTVSTITIPIDNKSYIHDTPGVLVKDSFYGLLEKSAIKYVIPRTEIRPKSFQLNSKQAVFIGGLAKIEIIDGSKGGYTFYVSNDVELHRCKLENTNVSFDSLVSRAKIRPTSVIVRSSEDLISHEFVLPEDKSVDIVISGLGWVATKGKGQKIIVKAPKGINVIIRDSEI